MKKLLCPSMMCADFSNLKKNVEELKEKLFVLKDRSGLDSYVKYFIKPDID